jgi:hypothetical protein
MHRRHLGSLLLLVLAGALGACAEQQPPINRVEAYALPKSLFTGEWYYGQTVVDVPGTHTVTMVGNTNYSGMYRIRWDIQEDHLYARKADELVEGAKGVDTQTGEYKGTIVGAWRITSHFDVKRAYNPTTGEEMNVIEENAADCKWYDCKYMRVDWSNNLAINYMFLDSDEGFQKDSMPFYEQDAHDPRWRPIFDQKNGYIDVTSSVVVKPQTFRYWRWEIPLCWDISSLMPGAHAECTPEIIKIRNSFWRRDPNRDFEPREHKGPHDEWFGFFVQERLTWENHYGITYKTKKKLINRHNIWDRHHYDTVDDPEAACLGSTPTSTACSADKDCQDKLKDSKATCNLTTKKCHSSGDAYCASKYGAGSRCDTLLRFHKFDVATDTDADGLADSFELEAGLNPEAADSNDNKVADGNEDRLGFGPGGITQEPNGRRDLEDFWAWDSANMEHRCTIPMEKRDPVPIPYFNTGFFPRSLICDEDRGNTAVDKVPGPCQPWSFVPPSQRDDKAGFTAKISVLHKISLDYDETFWMSFLKGVYGFTHDEYTKWISTHDVGQLPASKQEILSRFGDAEHGYYAFTICPNNPVQEYDPWPCRFPHMPFSKAKALMDEGRKFGTVDENGKEVAPYVRHGDIRFSMVNYVKDYYDGWALLGLGPSMTDPVTGENLAGVANVYALNDWAATSVQEMVQLLNNQISPTDFINGVNLENFIKKLDQSTKADSQHGFNKAVPFSDIVQMYQSMRQGWLDKIQKRGDGKSLIELYGKDELGNPLKTRQIISRLAGDLHAQGFLSKAHKPLDLSVVAGTPLEKHLVDEEVLMAAGYPPGTSKGITADVLQNGSLARGGFISQIEGMEQFRRELAHKRSMDFLSMTDDALDGLAARLRNLPTEKVWNTAREIIMRAVTTHEMGHTVGMHHNWAGSDDALNFHDQYWDLRSDNHTATQVCAKDGNNKGSAICPFALKPMSNLMRNGDPAKGIKSLFEYAYSSVMDYAGKYTIDGNGLGKYDKAAIMYGHVDKVEVFERTGTVPKVAGENVFEEWFESSANPFYFAGNDLASFHYTKWYAMMGKDAYDYRNRKVVDYRDIQDLYTTTAMTGTQRKGLFYVDPKTKAEYPRVPYAFCTYTRGDISDSCNTRDYGADHYERMKGDIDNWDTWYTLAAFPRFVYGTTKWSYINRGFRRYFRLKNYNDSYALYQGLFTAWFTPQELEAFFTDPVSGWGNYTIAMNNAFNMAMRTLTMPDVKMFELQYAPDGTKIWAEADYYSTNFRSSISNSRYFSTSWRDTNSKDQCGLMWWECLHHNGFYLDKIVTLFALSDPYTHYAGIDTSEDIRQWRIGFFENFSKQIVDVFGAILSEDYDKIAPWADLSKPADNPAFVDGNGHTWVNGMAWRDYVNPAKDPPKPTNAKSAPVEAGTRFTFQVYAALMGMLLFADNFDNEFLERSRMWKKGKDTTWTVTPGPLVDGVAEFVDPFNGSTYVGIAYKDGRGIAQRMIAHANKLKSYSTLCNSTPGLPDSCATPPAQINGTCPNTAANPCMQKRAEQELYQYRQLMDIIIQVTTLYNNEMGNWSWSPWNP